MSTDFSQLSSGVLALQTHYALGKFSRSKASSLALFFILGVETLVTIIWCFALSVVLPITSQIVFWIIAGILVIESTASIFFYYRKSPGTELFISRPVAKAFEARAKNIKNRSDAFMLGLLSGVPELVFTLPLYFLASIILPSIGLVFSSAIYILIYMLLAVTPLFIIHVLYRTDHYLPDIERVRIKLKPFIRFFLFVGFLLLALLIINFGIINHG